MTAEQTALSNALAAERIRKWHRVCAARVSGARFGVIVWRRIQALPPATVRRRRREFACYILRCPVPTFPLHALPQSIAEYMELFELLAPQFASSNSNTHAGEHAASNASDFSDPWHLLVRP